MRAHTIMETIFWISLTIIFYTFVGYGLVLAVIVALKPRRCRGERELKNPPRVTIFITAFNEEDVVDEKIANTLALDYPPQLVETLWVTDGSSDRTVELLSGYEHVRVLHDPQRRGKVAAMNRGMQYVNSPIVIFTDANAMINSGAVWEIVKGFQDAGVGCVAGEKRILAGSDDQIQSSDEGLYWRYESKLKRWDSYLGNCIGAAGELFALRTELFVPLSEDTLLDDFTLSLTLAMKGHRTLYVPDAYSQERGSADLRSERKRKVRIAAGGWQVVWRLRGLLNPFDYGLLSWQYISHRVLRWCVTPPLMVVVLVMNVFLYEQGTVYEVMIVAQGAFYLLALVGWLFSVARVRVPLLGTLYYFVFMNLCALRSPLYLWNNRQRGGVWERVKRA